MPSVTLRCLLAALACCVALPAAAARIKAELKNSTGGPLVDAVVYAVPAHGAGPTKVKREIHIEQIDKTFVPLVSVVQTGTSVNFPNRDSIRHHVYSFSPAKTFEIKLFVGVPATPVVFDKPGEVVLGCNIHDEMIAYVLVVETPYFARTGKDGKAQIDNVPAGAYELRVWHFGAVPPKAEKLQLNADATHDLTATLALKPLVPRPVRK